MGKTASERETDRQRWRERQKENAMKERWERQQVKERDRQRWRERERQRKYKERQRWERQQVKEKETDRQTEVETERQRECSERQTEVERGDIKKRECNIRGRERNKDQETKRMK